MNGRWKSKTLLLMVIAMAGCGGGEDTTLAMAGGDSLRIRTDTGRGRTWVLGIDEVRVYDSRKSRLIGKVALPGWSVARTVCPPDLVLDRSGSATISSNVQPRLWRIDANSLEVKEQAISLSERELWDIGFGALAFAADGTLFAVTSSANSLWKIDTAGARAGLVETYHPPVKACALTAQFVERIERSRKP